MATRKQAKAKTRPGQTKTRSAAKTRTGPSRKQAPAGRRAAARVPNRRKQEPETLRLRSIEPSFTVDDLERSIRFYTDVCGFIVSDRWTDAGGALRGVTVKAGACELNLGQDDWAKGRDRKKGEGFRVYCQTVQDIDTLASRIKAAGGQLAQEPTDQPWGVRSITIDDPDGFHLTLYRNL